MQIQKNNDIEALDVPDSALVRKILQGNSRALYLLNNLQAGQCIGFILVTRSASSLAIQAPLVHAFVKRFLKVRYQLTTFFHR